jgi:hypothetical protein
MLKPLACLVLAGLLSACTSQQASWNTGQFIKDKNCDPNSSISYKRCDTNIQEEYEQAQENKRELEADDEKDKKIQEALQRSKKHQKK